MEDSQWDESLKRVADALAAAEVVVLSTHENSDGDSVGSLLGLSMALRGRGTSVFPILPNGEAIPPHYRFLPGGRMLVRKDELPGGSRVFVALDCGNPDRLSDLREYAAGSDLLVNIDHHEDNTFFGGINLVEPLASCTSEIVFRVLRAGGFPVGEKEALCFYAGILTDTGRFRNVNTTPGALRTAAELLELGVNPEEVVSRIYEESSLSLLWLKGRVLERARMADGYPFVYSYITREDLEQTGADISETEDIIDCLRTAEGARAALLLKETADGRIRGSLRSKDRVSVGKVARALGGGGHERAAGFISDGSMQEILEEVRRLLAGMETGDAG